MDLGVLAAAPKRLIRAGLGDAICRSTAQGDWYMAHVLRGTPYRAMPFQLFADLEDGMVEEAAALVAGDLAAVERLAKVLLLSGFGMTICGGSYPASQGEHLISHTLEMAHAHGNGEEPLHGEQIAVTTMIMARLQDQMMAGEAPMARESTIGEAELVQQFGEETGRACWKELQPKLLDKAGAAAFTRRIAEHWPKLQNDLSRMRRPAAQIFKALKAAGAPTNYRDIGFTRQAISDAVQQARMIRNRYSFLDLAADSRRLIPERLVD
jgi:glycerol-1-phosphate dehydrogenase [NAD(P)+]